MTTTQPVRLLHIEQAIQDVAALVGRRVGQKRLKLTIRVGPGLPLIPIEEPTFKMIAYNLLECVVSSAPEKGEVCVAVGPAPRRDVMEGELIAFVVSENGPAVGMTEDDPEHLLRGYEQLGGERPRGEPRGQAGRLLASTRRLVESLGGRVWVTSEPGSGNALTFVLPVGRR